MRTQKTVNGVTTDYYYLNGVLQAQKTGEEYIIFLYDENGSIYGMTIKRGDKELSFYYLFNAQGDVIGIVDPSGSRYVSYEYDAWGNVTITGLLAKTIGVKNPIRYRGYYYDNETGFYYLQSRHYDPETCRVISADDIDVLTATMDDVTDKNLFAYCDNNPIVREDKDGDYWQQLALAGGGAVGGSWAAIANALSGALVAGGSNAWNPVGLAILGVVAVVAVIVVVNYASTNIKFKKSSSKSGTNVDPYGRPNQKKQGRERKENKKKNKNWKQNPNKKPKPLPKHTPGRNHRKYKNR